MGEAEHTHLRPVASLTWSLTSVTPFFFFSLGNQEVIGTHQRTKTETRFYGRFWKHRWVTTVRNASYLTVFNRHSGLTRYIWSAAVGRELFLSTRTGGESALPSKQLSKLLMAVTLAAFPHFTSRITWHAAMFQEFRILHNVTMHQTTNLTNNVTLMPLVHKHKKTRKDSHVCCCLPPQVQRLTNPWC